MTTFRYGQLPVEITRPVWLRGKYRASVTIGPNVFSRDGKTPERAALWLNISLPAFFEYGDSLKGSNPRAKNYREAEALSRALLRTNVRKARSA